jgi:stress response protein YsnF
MIEKMPLSAADAFRFARLTMMLHPDQLGEGIVSEAEVARRYAKRVLVFRERWEALEVEVGRKVTEEEAWSAVGK